MKAERAKTLLQAERDRVEQLLAELGAQDAVGREINGDVADGAERLTADGTREIVTASLTERLGAIERADRRLADGTYGRSIRSGKAIPDARLEADPTAELLVDERAERLVR
jgi:DnaK suppressor protein